MDEIKNGGPAFPTKHPALDPRASGFYTEDGMTLRDYFATHEQLDPNESIGLGLAERLAGRPHPAPRDEGGKLKAGADPVEVAIFWADAESAYRYLRADAMIRAREANHG
jgi:hypothetical protein